MENTELFRNLMIMAVIDGAFTQGEMEMLSDRCAEWGISEVEFESALKDALAPDAELTIPRDLPSQVTYLKECLRMMGADGRLADQEKHLFSVAAAQMKITESQLNEIIDEVLVSDD